MNRPLLGTSASEIGIDRDDAEPIQSQIARQIARSGPEWPPEAPGQTALDPGACRRFAIARATVVEAYQQLLSEGYMETRSRFRITRGR